jgi:phosphate transport system substrate-binding protein
MLSRLVLAVVAVAVLAGCGGGNDNGGSSGGGTANGSGQLKGSGSSFQDAFNQEVISAYKEKAPDVTVTYNAVGSGTGKQEFGKGLTDFAGTDSLVKDTDGVPAGSFVYVPTVAGPITVSYNLSGVDKLQLSPDTVADIFQAKITKWNDPAIAKDNPGASLPDTAITVAHRSDGSGTTFNFAYYLADVSNDWRVNVGVSTSVEWPVGIGGKGNEGVAATVAQTTGSIGYVEYAYALQNKMTYTKMINKDGKTVAPSAETFAAAAANADWANARNFYLILANQPGADSWPMTAATFIVMYKKPVNAGDSLTALKFFDWAFRNGQPAADQLHYIMLPKKVQNLIVKRWSAVQAGGKPVYTPAK